MKTQAGEEGYVWSHFVQVVAAPATSATAFHPDTGVAGSAEMVGCGDGLWQHVYHPSRLIVKQDCVTITGKIVDATAPHHHADGMRHEADGDTHGWLQVDPQFAAAINAGNTSDEPRRSARTSRSRGHSCRKRITRSGTGFIRCRKSK